ncbi:MAG: ubiquinone/menaquinone biosynthesis methyltransferase [Dehalococcoidia bacterium]
MPKKPLQAIFTALPPRYDLINSIITWGLDKRWRRLAAQECLRTKPRRILDLCCGTGDLTLELARRASKGVEISGLDFSRPMLDRAARKAAAAGRGDIRFTHGDAAEMPFADGSFDCVSISFAFRNLTYRNPMTAQYLAEIGRVLAAGGRFVAVETSQPSSPPIRWLYHLYLRCFAAPVGYCLSGNRGAFRYFAESASRFFTPQELTVMMKEAGFGRVTFRPLFLGAAAIMVAEK